MRDGYVFIMGRADDCFKSKGVLIAPRELEEAILRLGEFEEACVCHRRQLLNPALSFYTTYLQYVYTIFTKLRSA